MTTEHRTSDGPSIYTFHHPEKLTPEAIEDTKQMAKIWQSREVITAIDWDDPFMTATNQIGTFSFPVFHFSREGYAANWEQVLGLSFHEFCVCFLAALVCSLGKWALPSLQGLVRDGAKFVCKNAAEFKKWVQGGAMEQPHLFHDFFLLLPVAGEAAMLVEHLADIIDYSGFSGNSKRRDLPSIRTFLTFRVILHEYLEDGSDAALCLYGPLRLWWTISTIVPLRPIEFLMTPYDCIHKSPDGVWYLSLRRNRIKGSNKLKAYKIQEDFELVKYQVPQYVADEVLRYKTFAEKNGARPCHLDTLLMPDLHYKGMGWEKPDRPCYYTYANFNHALQTFQEDVIAGEHHYEIRSDRSMASAVYEENVLYRILPGDTRHLALLNAAREGVQPQTLMEIVRHYSINQTYWYAANDAVLQACATSKAYMENMRRNVPVPVVPLVGSRRIKDGDPFIELSNGRCYSPGMNSKDPDAADCIQSTDPHGELGWCPSCPYFRQPDGKATFDPSRFVLDAQSDWELLLETIECYRKDVLHEDSLIQAFEKARTAVNSLLDLVMREIGSDTEEQGNGSAEEA